jgi:circadian clock protein KaiB
MIKSPTNKEVYELKLYVTGMSASSVKAIENIKSICEEFLAGRYDLEIIDIYQFPDSMYENDIIASPTLIKKAPSPFKRLIGDLSHREEVIAGLAITKD